MDPKTPDVIVDTEETIDALQKIMGSAITVDEVNTQTRLSKRERRALQKAKAAIRAIHSEKDRTPTYTTRDKFWIGTPAAVLRQASGEYLVAFKTRGALLRYHREDSDLTDLTKAQVMLVRYNRLREICLAENLNGVLIDPPCQSEDDGNVQIEVLALGPL